jgi:hypothetical protein
MSQEQAAAHSESASDNLAKLYGEGQEPEPEAAEDTLDAPAPEEGAEEPAQPEPEPLLLKVKINGEEKDITAEEAARGYMRQEDYTQKTQALAEQRKQFTEQMQQEIGAIVSKMELLEQVFSSPVASELEIIQLRAQNPQQAAQLEAQNFQQRQLLQQLQAEKARYMQQVAERQTQMGLEYLQQKAPDILEPQTKASIADFLQKQGYKPEELNQLYDPRALIIADKARKWDELQAKQGEVKAKAAPVVQKTIEAKGKAPMPAQTKNFLTARQRMESGKANSRDIASVLDYFYNQKR